MAKYRQNLAGLPRARPGHLLRLADGKASLKAIRRRVQDLWGVSFGNARLVEAMTSNEIDPDITNIIKRLEAL